jgi:hypothetical protein
MNQACCLVLYCIVLHCIALHCIANSLWNLYLVESAIGLSRSTMMVFNTRRRSKSCATTRTRFCNFINALCVISTKRSRVCRLLLCHCLHHTNRNPPISLLLLQRLACRNVPKRYQRTQKPDTESLEEQQTNLVRQRMFAVCARCATELLVAKPHFNFRSNLLYMIIPLSIVNVPEVCLHSNVLPFGTLCKCQKVNRPHRRVVDSNSML